MTRRPHALVTARTVRAATVLLVCLALGIGWGWLVSGGLLGVAAGMGEG